MSARRVKITGAHCLYGRRPCGLNQSKGMAAAKGRVKQEQTRTTEVDYSIGTVTVPIRNRAMGALVTKSQLPRHRCASRQGADGSIKGAPSILEAWMFAHPQKNTEIHPKEQADQGSVRWEQVPPVCPSK